MVEKRIVFSLILIAVIIIAIVVLMVARGPPQPVINSTSTNTTTIIPTLNQTLNISITTTIPLGNSTNAQARLQSDLSNFSSVPNILLLYNSTMPAVGINGSSYAPFRFYKKGNETRLMFVSYVNGLPTTISSYRGKGASNYCGQLPIYYINQNSPSSPSLQYTCFISSGNQSMQIEQIRDFFLPNASDYVNLVYMGQQSVNGSACDSFSGKLSSGKQQQLINTNITPPNSQNLYATLCVNPIYGYPVYNIITEPPAAQGQNSPVLAGIAAIGIYLNGTSDASIAKPASFAVSLDMACTNHSVSFSFMPFKNLTNPVVSLGISSFNSLLFANQTLGQILSNNSANSTALNLSISKYTYNNFTANQSLTGLFSQMTEYPVTINTNQKIDPALMTGMYVCIAGQCEPTFTC
jgi:hypothetical protein